MELGTSIALFLGLAVALMILFCLVTKYSTFYSGIFSTKWTKDLNKQDRLFLK